MGELTFNQERHEYAIDGVIIPSVTQVLEAAGLSDLSMVRQSILERACNFGKAVHKMIELADKGTLDFTTLDENLLPYLEGWKNFVEDFGYICHSTEFRFFHPVYKYAGTIDQLGKITTGKFIGDALGDIKTGLPYPSHKYQLNGGYSLAFGKKCNTFILYLNPDHKPRGYKVVFASNSKREQGVFLSALSLYNVRKEEGLI